MLQLAAILASKSAADEGRDIILSMLVVGLVFLALVFLGDFVDWRGRKRR